MEEVSVYLTLAGLIGEGMDTEIISAVKQSEAIVGTAVAVTRLRHIINMLEHAQSLLAQDTYRDTVGNVEDYLGAASLALQDAETSIYGARNAVELI
jgi:hypothetical protein